MKNDRRNYTSQGRSEPTYKTLHTDVLVVPEVVERNKAQLSKRPKRKRRINYEKKIMNDSFIFTV